MPAETPLLDFDKLLSELNSPWRGHEPGLSISELGVITSVSTGIATVRGLPGIGFEELVEFPGGLLGIAFELLDEEVGVVLLGDHSHLRAGDEVARTGRVMDVPVGDELL